jgi:ABC-2 type transport system ATP-binding protein
MIHVHALTKYYGDYPAVRGVSFDVAAGQVVGFLGPNGAGKSTTMRIIAGYLTATSGSVTIDGIDVFWDPVTARRRIGYMPESCPLYPELRVREYLHFRAGLKGLVGKARRDRIDYVVRRCWLLDEDRTLIGNLSKGYRQRVGLADALLADPAVLILDEPTAGLDPTQIRETRDLIRELGQQHTILLSTHILSEVEMTCRRAIIIHHGRVAAAGDLGELARSAGEATVLTAVVGGPADVGAVRALPGVTSVEPEPGPGTTTLKIVTPTPDDVAARVVELAARDRWPLRELRPRRQTLEELFVRITREA